MLCFRTLVLFCRTAVLKFWTWKSVNWRLTIKWWCECWFLAKRKMCWGEPRWKFIVFCWRAISPERVRKLFTWALRRCQRITYRKLEETGLVRKEKGELIVNKVIFGDCMRFRRFLIPRYLFYSVFAVLALIIEGHFFQAHCNYELILLCNCNSCLCVDLLFWNSKNLGKRWLMNLFC